MFALIHEEIFFGTLTILKKDDEITVADKNE
jgi:hypothetical protein